MTAPQSKTKKTEKGRTIALFGRGGKGKGKTDGGEADQGIKKKSETCQRKPKKSGHHFICQAQQRKASIGLTVGGKG